MGLGRSLSTRFSVRQIEATSEVFADGHHQLHEVAAKSYLKALSENKSVLLVAPTWNEIEAVTEKVRAELKLAGRLSGEDKEFQVFDSLSWTEAQKRDARQYRPGMAIHFHRTTHGFDKNETVAVVAVENNSLKVDHSDGTESFFPLGQGSALYDVGKGEN